MTAAPKGPAVDIVIQSPLWEKLDCEAMVRRAIAAAATRASEDAELSVLLTDDDAIRALNSRWRQRDEPTNVLSFPAAPLPGNPQPRHLGDIVVAYETTAREAAVENKRIEHHLAHLAVHGFLHLLGYDHESEAEAEAMERLEREILARLDIADPYAVRDAG